MALHPQRLARRFRPAGLLAAALIVVAASYAVSIGSRTGRPIVPFAPPPVAGQGAAVDGPIITGTTVADIDANIRTWGAKAAADPNDYISAANLGVLYLGRARLTSDVEDYGRAAAATERALDAFPAYAPARALDATVRFATHDFTGALTAAEALLADSPGDPDALAVVGDASLELGRIDVARDTYAKLATITPGPALDVRLARLAYVTGDPDRALDIARRARVAANDAGVIDPAFFDYQLGEFARLAGDAATARQGYTAALAARPANLPALVGLARVDAATGDTVRAIESLTKAAAIAPQPEVLALLGDLLAETGDVTAAADQFATVRVTAQLSALAGVVFDRQLIAFELDHGGATNDALVKARSSAMARPDAAGHDLVAWSLHRLGRDDEAATESAAARSTGIVDARMTFHAGAIALARGDVTGGKALLQQALDLGPALDPADRAEAERLLGD
jgi:tetratricopeptide (TPR) repeat protein